MADNREEDKFMSLQELKLVEQREIEAMIAGPLIRGYIEALGRERAMEIASGTIRTLARDAGRRTAEKLGGNTLFHLAKVVREMWAQDNVLELNMLEETTTTLAFNVTRCGYARMYESKGLRDLGFCLSCCRDGAFAEGFNPDIRMTRTRTLMEGGPYCDFRFSLRQHGFCDPLI